jgi:hypothetical protein
MALRIHGLEVSPWVEQKINAKHHVSIDDVLDACENVDAARWVEDDHARRLVLHGRTAFGRALELVLYPVDIDQGEWRLGTAYPLVP